ncbi:WG repeat-containing protein [Psychrobacter sanguinis]|uniref:WG repeat-containing protein n=1 Tax=Psychrobacter sanguinis TaxID=861445 RepID=UPI001918FDB9|nr:WG repeat-containing protein [Psychrobacter sanguinis]MCC3344407.1 WG repeat-containing protein [Psychrobacter sanguinis]
MSTKPALASFTTKLIPLVTVIGIACFALPAQANYEDDCKPPKTSYPQVDCTTDGNYFIAKDKNYSYQALLNKQGKAVASLKGYDSVSWTVSDGVLAVMKNDKVGYINTQGKLVVPAIYDNLIDPDDKYDETWSHDASEGRIVVAKNGKYGIIDTSNKVILPFTSKYSFIDGVKGGMALVQSQSGKYGFVDKNGKEVIPPKYQGTSGHFGGYYGFQQGLAGMYDGKKWGYITKSGKVAVPFIYDEIRPFSEGVAGVLKNGKWGFIDGSNKTVIPFQFSDKNVARYSVNYMGANYFVFDNGIAEVAMINDKEICINKSGKSVACPN